MEQYWARDRVLLFGNLALSSDGLGRVGRTRRQLAGYFKVDSIPELIIELRAYSRNGYFNFEASLDEGYLAQEKAHTALFLRTDVLRPLDPFGLLELNPYRLSVNTATPLSERELREVVKMLPADIAEQHLRFKLVAVNRSQIKSELDEYLDLYRHIKPNAKVGSFAVQRNKLRKAMARRYPIDKYRPLIRQSDIWPEMDGYPLPFWELALSEHFSGRIRIEELGSQSEALLAGSVEWQPVARIAIADKVLRQNIREESRLVRRSNKSVANEEVEYNGLWSNGVLVSYKDQPIKMGYQQQQVVYAFIRHHEELVSPESLMENQEIFGRPPYNDKRRTLGKLIPEVNKILKKAVGRPCIINVPKEGWYLKI